MYLLDTNVVSELRKGARGDRNVIAWYSRVAEEETFLCALVFGEIRKGIEIIRDRDSRQASALNSWLGNLKRQYAGRILPIDDEIAEAWGRMYYVRNVSPTDGLLAATALVHNMTLVTRNVSDVEGLGVRVLNPFNEQDGLHRIEQ